MEHSSVKSKLSVFDYEILALVGRGGAGPHDLLRMAKQSRIYAWAGESQYYVAPKRLARLGLLADMPACTDLTTRPWLMEAGVRVEEAPFHARGPIATAGGCMASQYLAAWVMLRVAGEAAATRALHYVAPVGEKDTYVKRVLDVVRPFVA